LFQSQVWCVLLGAAPLGIALATYGYNVTRAMGTLMAKLTPSRGFAAELATALVILVASQLGLPTSSRQCISGGIVGVGIMESLMGGGNSTGRILGSTLFIVGLGVAALFLR
jgi:sodium-dependent phosphate transporter